MLLTWCFFCASTGSVRILVLCLTTAHLELPLGVHWFGAVIDALLAVRLFFLFLVLLQPVYCLTALFPSHSLLCHASLAHPRVCGAFPGPSTGLLRFPISSFELLRLPGLSADLLRFLGLPIGLSRSCWWFSQPFLSSFYSSAAMVRFLRSPTG